MSPGTTATGTRAARPPVDAGRWRGGWRDFPLLWLGQGASSLGSSVTNVAVPLVAVATLHASAFAVALLSVAAWLPWLLIGLPVGAWVDRMPRRRPLMIACDLASLLLYLSVPVAAGLGVLTIAQLLVVALGAGVAKVFFATAYQVYLPTLLTGPDLPAGNARLQGTESATQVAGPGVAGVIAATVGAVAALLVDAASFLISALCLAGIRSREPRRPGRDRPVALRRDIGEGIRYVARDPCLRTFTLFGAASNLGLIGYQSILVVFLVREVGVSAGVVGGLLAATSLGGVLGAALANRLGRWLGTARATLLGAAVAMPSGLLIPLAGQGARLALPVAGGLLISAGVVAGNVLKGAFRQRYVPRHLLGRATSSMQLVNLGAMPLGALAAGVLAGAYGVRAAMWITTGWLALTVLILLGSPLRRLRDLPTPVR